MNTKLITIVGVGVIVFYGFSQLLAFFGINYADYIMYILFYVFLIISLFILPNGPPP
jgi:hypothetical protein